VAEEQIVVYTDGACSGNPGKGGWAAILLYKNHKKSLYGAYRKTTNNRMELMAVIESLKAIKKKDIPVVVYSDSQYVVNGINEYLKQWEAKNFNKVKNPDLWKQVLEEMRKFTNIKFEWVKGHENNTLNNECDKLAVEAYQVPDNSPLLKIDEVYERNNN